MRNTHMDRKPANCGMILIALSLNGGTFYWNSLLTH
jgi:hypothetical protein